MSTQLFSVAGGGEREKWELTSLVFSPSALPSRSSVSFIRVDPIPNKELGAVATKFIPKGTLVIEETPLFVLCVRLAYRSGMG